MLWKELTEWGSSTALPFLTARVVCIMPSSISAVAGTRSQSLALVYMVLDYGDTEANAFQT